MFIFFDTRKLILSASTPSAEPSESQSLETHQLVGRILGPAIFVLMLIMDQWQTVMPTEAWRAAAIGLWMAVWWATEAIPVPVTAFLPIIVFAPLGIASTERCGGALRESNNLPVSRRFPVGALSLERWNLSSTHRVSDPG